MFNFLLAQSQQSGGGEPAPGTAVVGRGSRRGGGRILPEQMQILRTRPVAVQASKKGNFIITQINVLIKYVFAFKLTI